MDFDFLLAGTEIEYDGRKYMYLKRVNLGYTMAVEVGVSLPAPVVIIPAQPPTKGSNDE